MLLGRGFLTRSHLPDERSRSCLPCEIILGVERHANFTEPRYEENIEQKAKNCLVRINDLVPLWLVEYSASTSPEVVSIVSPRVFDPRLLRPNESRVGAARRYKNCNGLTKRPHNEIPSVPS